MHVEAGRDGSVNGVQKLAELYGTVLAMAVADDLAGGNVQGCEQGCCPVADVVMCPAFDLARAHGQERLGPVERLDLRVLIDAEDQCSFRRVEIAESLPDDVAHLPDEERISREFEGL